MMKIYMMNIYMMNTIFHTTSNLGFAKIKYVLNTTT